MLRQARTGLQVLKPTDFEVLPAELALGTARAFARRHLIRYRHPAVRAPEDFLASLEAAFGPPPEPNGYVLWHRETGRHFTAYFHTYEPVRLAAYGGGLCFSAIPSEPAMVAEAYAKASAQLRSPPSAADPLVADLLGDSGSYQAHLGEVGAARELAPNGFYEFLVRFETELLTQFPPPDRREVAVYRGEASVQIFESGVRNGRYFERSPKVKDAFAAVREETEDEVLATLTFYRWWADKPRPPKLPPEISTALVPAWRASRPVREEDGAGFYDEAAKARHEDHARAERWMSYARAGLKLPLELSDLDFLAMSARGLARQSNEFVKVNKERRKRTASA